MYVVTRDDLYLVPTAEVPVTNIHRDEIIEAARLPIRYVAYSPCFRREAGAAGRATRGILRVHQFDKVEMVAFEKPADSTATLEWMTERAEVSCSGSGWLIASGCCRPATWASPRRRRTTSRSGRRASRSGWRCRRSRNFRDFQARRMNIRWRPAAGAKPEILHTLNGSGLALPRTVAALLETYQQQDGSVLFPEPLASLVGPLSPPA